MKRLLTPLAALLLAPLAALSAADEPTQAAYDYPTEAMRVPLVGQIFSPLTWEQAKQGVPEIKIISKQEEEIEYVGDKKDLVDDQIWKESPSRILYHGGKYHVWLMHLDTRIHNDGMGFRAKNFYLTSTEGYKWEVMDEIPNGEPGSFDDVWREGLQVVKFDSKFWMFYAGNTRDPSKTLYGGRVNAYGIGLLVADNPVRKEIFTDELKKKIERMDKEFRPIYWREVYDPGKIPKPVENKINPPTTAPAK